MPHPIDLSEWPAERISRVASIVRHSPHKNTVYARQLADVAESLAAEREAAELVQRIAMIERCSHP